MRSRVSWLGLAVSVLALGGVIWWASRQEAPELPSSGPELLALVGAIALYGVNTVVRAERWQALLVHDDARPARADTYALTVIGYTGNNVLPARAGDAVRVVLLAPRAETSKRTVIGTLLAERILDVAVVVALFLVVGGAVLHELSDERLWVLATATGLAIAAALAAWLVLRRNARLRAFVAPMLSSTLRLRGRHGAWMLALSLVIWLMEGAVWMSVGAAVGYKMTPIEGLYLVALASVFALIPSGPGYAGTQDAAVVIGIKGIGGSGSTAVSYLVMLRFVLVVPITTLGFLLLATRYGGISRLREATRREAVTADA